MHKKGMMSRHTKSGSKMHTKGGGGMHLKSDMKDMPGSKKIGAAKSARKSYGR